MKLLIGSAGALLLVRLLLSAVFLDAALPKLQDPAGFTNDIAAYQLTGAAVSAWVAIILPWAELACAIGLLIPWTRRASGLLLSLLLAAFIGLHLSAWARGLDIACGCFGNETADYEANYPWLLARNLLLLAGVTWTVRNDFRNNPTRSAA